MENIRLPALLAIIFACVSVVAFSQPRTKENRGHGHGGTTLFLAQAEAAKVVPPSPSLAAATGAFLIDPVKRTVSYDLTFHGLEHGPAKSIALYNSGAGRNGAVIHTICGSADRPCPNLASANLTGTWDGQGPPELDGELLGEFASARVYIEVVGGDGQREIRGQLEPNGAMVPVSNFVAHLAPTPGVDTQAAGTAVLSEVHFVDGRISVFYQVTVAGTSSTPRGAALVGVPAATGPSPLEFLSRNALPKLRLMPSRSSATGGTMTGQYEVTRKQQDALFATRLLSAGSREVAIAISTDRFPDGELYGVFKPVQ
jgi:CHRD domain